jgi:hypothetical protein
LVYTKNAIAIDAAESANGEILLSKRAHPIKGQKIFAIFAKFNIFPFINPTFLFSPNIIFCKTGRNIH